MSTRQTTNQRHRGFVLTEFLVSLGASGFVLAAVATTAVYSARSFALVGDHSQLSAACREALDRMSKDIRASDYLASFTTNSLTFHTTDPLTSATNVLSYSYDPIAQTLARTVGTNTSRVLVQNCTFYQCDLFQRSSSLTNGGDLIPLASTNPASMVKGIAVTLNCARTNLGRIRNAIDLKTGRIVIRKA